MGDNPGSQTGPGAVHVLFVPPAGSSQDSAQAVAPVPIAHPRTGFDQGETGQIDSLSGSHVVAPAGLTIVLGNATGLGPGGSPAAQRPTAGGNLPAQTGSLLDADPSLARSALSASGATQRLVLAGIPDPVQAPLVSADREAPTSDPPARPAAKVAAGLTAGDPDEEVPSPRGADLIAQVLPFEFASLERALEQFVRHLDDLDVRTLVTRGPTPLVLFTLTLLGSAAAVELARRSWRRRRSGRWGLRIADPLGRDISLGFPELPGSWTERRR
jgi:hypothetical protein